MQAMIFAAGKGTRLKPLTDIIPKALVPVADRPLLQHVMDRMAEAGAEHVVVNVHHHARQVENFIRLARSHYPYKTDISDETQQLLETGGAVKKARPLLAGTTQPILIHNVDILSNVRLHDFYRDSHDADATLLVSCRQTQRYLLFGDDMRLVGWTNIATGQVRSPYADIAALDGDREAVATRFKGRMYAFSGIHCLAPTLFPEMDSWEDRFPIMDFYLSLCAKKQIKGIVREDLRLLDVGKLDTLAAAEEFLSDGQ